MNDAARAKKDEFYTQYADIQRELNCYYNYDKNFLRGKTILLPCDDPQRSNFTKFFAANFELYGLKKLISTGYAFRGRGKIFTLDAADYPLDALKDGWQYLQGDGDFRSTEVKALRDAADVIITNPPFSMFRQFLRWILDADKKFLIIGNMNAVTYKEIFPLIMQDKIWLGNGFRSGDPCFTVPDDYEEKSSRFWIDERGQKWRSFGNLHWFTNLELRKRHEDILLYMNYSPDHYPRYDTCDAIEVSKTAEIPRDWFGVMGVPITFLDKYNPAQFEIVGKIDSGAIDSYNLANPIVNGKSKYKRIAIRRR